MECKPLTKWHAHPYVTGLLQRPQVLLGGKWAMKISIMDWSNPRI